MDTALGWIGELARWFAAWIPRLVIVDVRYRAVLFRRGKIVRERGPGLVIYWPLVTVLELWPVNLQTLRLESQSLRTIDRIAVEMRILVVFWVADLKTLLVELHDPDSGIGELCLGAARQVVCSSTLEELESDSSETDSRLINEIRKLIHPLGVRVKRARFTDLTPAPAMKLFGIQRQTAQMEER